MFRSWLLPVRAELFPYLAFAMLAATALVPVLWDHPGLYVALIALAAAGVILRAAATAISARPDAGAGRGVGRRSRPPLARPAMEMALHLSPVALLTFVFPIASHRIASAQVGGADLTTLLLASSLTVPWLSQAVCLPLYRAIGHLITGGDMDQIQRTFCTVWPSAFVQTVPAIALFAVPVELATRWSLSALATYVALCVLHLAFAQSLVLANVGRRRVLWAVAWGSYAAALFIAPTAWYLPPLVGLASQLVAMRRYLPQMRHPVTLDRRDVALDLLRGVLLGAVLWSDKFFFFLRSDGQFAVTTVFLALLPAILAYNYYFVRLAPGLDRSVGELRSAMENEPYQRLAERSRMLAASVESSIGRTALIGACLAFLVTNLVQLREPGAVFLTVAVALASWLFMMTTVLCYKLDYIGQTMQAQVFSGVHLALCLTAFVALPLGGWLYIVLALSEVLLFAAALRSCLTHWRSSEYTLFWRHATAW